MTRKKSTTEVVHCNNCGAETTHLLIAGKCTESGGFSQGEQRYDVTSQMFECCGCGGVTFVRRTREEGWGHKDPVTGEWVWDDVIEYFPPAVSRRAPAWFKKLPRDMVSLLGEIYSAVHSGSRRLATMGARAVIDMVMVDKVGDVGTFPDKLDALAAQGYLSKRGRHFLEAALEVGSAASHRGHAASTSDVNHVMDIVENMLQRVYVLKSAADELKQSTPSRRRRKKKPKKKGGKS